MQTLEVLILIDTDSWSSGKGQCHEISIALKMVSRNKTWFEHLEGLIYISFNHYFAVKFVFEVFMHISAKLFELARKFPSVERYGEANSNLVTEGLR
jgi:hypothetical protein